MLFNIGNLYSVPQINTIDLRKMLDVFFQTSNKPLKKDIEIVMNFKQFVENKLLIF